MLKFIFAIFFFYSLDVFAQTDTIPHTLLWKIEGHGLTKTSYLYGTMHTGSDKAFHLMDSVLIGFKASEEFAMEINPDSINQKELGKEALLPDGTTLQDLLSPADYKIVKKAFWKRVHLPLALFQKVQPFYIMEIMEEGGITTNPKEILDLYFFNLAKQENKPVHGLEKADDQLAILKSISLSKQTELLVETAKTKGLGSEMDSLEEAYNQRDLNTLYKMTTSDTSLGAAFNKRLIDDRNKVMAAQIEKLILKPEHENPGPVEAHSVFVAVGAAHLPGPNGVIALLRKKGYSVKPVISKVFLKPKKVRAQLED
jgi:uncharacterized protein YbaP (TraB family)